MPPNFRDLCGSLAVLYFRWFPRSFHWGWLAISLGLVAIPVRAQTLGLPSPTDKSERVPADPVLTWTYGTTNLLSNGSFENGTNGWTLGLAKVVVASPPSSAAEGFHVLSGREGYLVQRDLTLPDLSLGPLIGSGGSLSLSFQARLLTPGLGVSLEFLDAVRPPVTLPITANYLGGKWRNFGADLSPYAGHSIRLKWSFLPADQVTWNLDDVQLTRVPGGIEFDVWFSTNGVAQLTRLGRTGHPSWPLHFLPASRQCYWRVDVMDGPRTNTGPVWTFRTDSFLELSQVIVDPLPELICDQQPLRLGLRLADENGFSGLSPGRTYNLTPRVDAFGEGVRPPPVVVTELNLGSETMEFQNVSGQLLDLSGWLVDVLHADDTTNARVRLRVPAGSTLAPGGLFQAQLRNATTPVWPRLHTSQTANWSATGRAGVVLRDAASNVVDCVFLKRPVATVARPDWPGLPATNTVPSGQSFQRTGGRDRNSADDWLVATATLGKTNAGLTLPFERGIGPIPAVIPNTTVRTDGNGYFTLPVQLTGPASNVVLFATAGLVNSRTTYAGQSTPFRVGRDLCLEVTVPANFAETAGRVADGVRVSIAEPRDTDVDVKLQLPWGSYEGVTAPAEITIPAGATEATGALTVSDNTEITGPRTLALTATAAGFAPATTSLVVQDDERAALHLQLPASLPEGSQAEGFLFIEPPPSRPFTATILAANPDRLGFSVAGGAPGMIPVPAGAGLVPILVQAYDNQRIEDSTNVPVRAEFANWTPGLATVELTENDPRTISLNFLGFGSAIEGGSNVLQILLGGSVTTNLPVTLTFQPAGRVVEMDPVVIPAGQREAIVSLTAIDDTLTNGTATVTVQANASGWSEGVGTFLVVENDPARLILQQPPGPLMVGQEFTIHVETETIDGGSYPNYLPTNLAVSVIDADQRPLAMELRAKTLAPSGFDVRLAINEPSPAARVHLQVGDAMADSVPLAIWTNAVPHDIFDLAYDEPRDRLIFATRFDPLFSLDPATGTRMLIAPELNYVGTVALADDGETLHANVYPYQAAQVELSTLKAGPSWFVASLGEPPRMMIDQLAPLPGQPHTIAVVLVPEQLDVMVDQTIKVFDGTNARPVTAIFPSGRYASLLPGLEPGQLFAASFGQVSEFNVSADGIRATEQPWRLFLQPGEWARGSDVFSHGLMFSRQAELIDPALPGRAGGNGPYLNYNAAATDPHTGRIAWYRDGPNPVFCLLDPLTLREVWRTTRLGTSGRVPYQMKWAGPHRWAINVQNEVGFLTDTAPDLLAATDLAVTASVIARDPQSVRATARVRVENRGTNPAPDVRLTFALPESRPVGPEAVALLGVSSNAVPTTNGLGGRSFALGDLAPGAAVEVTADLRGYEDGRVDASAFVGSSAADPEPKNNRATIRTTGLLPTLALRVNGPPVDGVVLLEFPTLVGWNFEIQNAPTIKGPWNTPSKPIAGTGEAKSMYVPQGEDAARFWRVLMRLP